MEFTPHEICLAVLVATTLLCLQWLACRWFYRHYLHNEGNRAWMMAEDLGSHTKYVVGWIYRAILLIVQAVRELFIYVGMFLLSTGGICFNVVRIFWSFVAIPFIACLTLVLAIFSTLCLIPGLLYGLCWASHDAGEFIGLLSPSHQHKKPRVQAKRE
jgi:hypothetical protein